MHTVYKYAGRDSAEWRSDYSSLVRQEFYDGDLEAGTSDALDLTIEKALAEPMALLRISTNVPISYRRSWQHIRANKVGVRVVWFVRRGSLKIVRSRASCIVSHTECAILDSSLPFFAQATPDADGVFEAVQAIVPAHLFLSHLPAAVEFDRAFPIETENRHMMAELLDLMFREGESISPKAAHPLVAAFLEILSDCIAEYADGPKSRLRVVDKRLADIEAYILKHLTDPDLGYDEVAAKCGISPRYLCYVLKANNSSFSTLLWSQRLPKARDWLAASALSDYPIQEIAFMAGFKSPAHFSRMFKATYGCSPKEYRPAWSWRSWATAASRSRSTPTRTSCPPCGARRPSG